MWAKSNKRRKEFCKTFRFLLVVYALCVCILFVFFMRSNVYVLCFRSMKLHLWYRSFMKTQHRKYTENHISYTHTHTHKILAFDLSTTKQNCFCLLSRICVWYTPIPYTDNASCMCIPESESTTASHAQLHNGKFEAASSGKSENIQMPPHMIH